MDHTLDSWLFIVQTYATFVPPASQATNVPVIG